MTKMHVRNITGLPAVLDKFDDFARQTVVRAMAEVGITVVAGSFEKGAVVTSTNEGVYQESTGKVYSWFTDATITVPAGTTPQNFGGVNATAWVDRTDVTFQADEWINCFNASYVSPNSLKVSGNQTDSYIENRKVRVDNGQPEYSYSSVNSAVYASGETSITLNDDIVTTGVDSICTSVVSQNSSVNFYDIGETSGYQASGVSNMIDGITTSGVKLTDRSVGDIWSSGGTKWEIVSVPVTSISNFKALNDVWIGDFGAKGETGVDDALSFLDAKNYIESLSTKTRMMTLRFDVLNLMSQVVINNYSAPFILYGNKIYDEFEVNEPCLIYGEDLSSNGIYEFQVHNFHIENRTTTLGSTKTIGFLVYHSAYHVGVGITTSGFVIGHKVISCIGASYDMQNRTSTNEVTNFQARRTGSRRNNLLQYRNHKHKLTGANAIAWDIEDAGGSIVESMVYDVLPVGSRPFRMVRAYEQSLRNSCIIRGGWMENYGERPAEIIDSIVNMEQYFAVPRSGGVTLPQTKEYAVAVSGQYSRISAKDVFVTSEITSHVFNLDTSDMTAANLALCKFDNVSGGTSVSQVVPSNLQSLNGGGTDGYPHRFFTGGNAGGFSFDLETILAADGLQLPPWASESTIEMELTGTSSTAMDYMVYKIGVRFVNGGYHCRSVKFIGGSMPEATVTVSFPSTGKPTFTFANPTGAVSDFASLTANFRFTRPSSRFS